MMNKAKKEVIIDTLKANGNAATYEVLFQAAEDAHCDVLAAALKSLKKSKVVEYEGQMLLMPMNKDVTVSLVMPDFDPLA